MFCQRFPRSSFSQKHLALHGLRQLLILYMLEVDLYMEEIEGIFLKENLTMAYAFIYNDNQEHFFVKLNVSS